MQERDAKPAKQSDYLKIKDIKQGQSRTLSNTPGFYLTAESQLIGIGRRELCTAMQRESMNGLCDLRQSPTSCIIGGHLEIT